MQTLKRHSFALVLAAATTLAGPARAAITVSEVAPWSSGNSPVGADWFELTNTGAAAVDISGWTMDDNSNAFSASVALRGISSIAAHASVIFIESTLASGDAAVNASFVNTWFGANAPAGLQIGNYGGSGVGLSAAADAVNVFNAAGALQANVVFGASPGGPYATFDNAAGLNNATISQLSAVGVNGAFKAANDAAEIGSPGTVAAVPEVATLAMMLAGLAGVGAAAHVRRRTPAACVAGAAAHSG